MEKVKKEFTMIEAVFSNFEKETNKQRITNTNNILYQFDIIKRTYLAMDDAQTFEILLNAVF